MNSLVKGFSTLIISIFAYGLLILSASAADSPADLSHKMDQLLSDIYSADAPGASILVVKDGKTLLRKAYGMANLEHNIPLRSDMVFRIGSVTKQFTSTAIMMLVEQGKIKLKDSITEYLPKYPLQGHQITIENLLNHTSGIKSYTGMGQATQKLMIENLTVPELIETFKDQPMDFAPSSDFKYNNSGYVLLGAIIEKVSGKSYADFIQDEIFTPLGMTQSYYDNHNKIIANRVMGYAKTKDGFQNADYINMRIPYAAGSLLSTVDDLQKWETALFTGKVVSKASFTKMTTPYVLLNGKKAGYGESADYGFGLVMSGNEGHPAIFHNGGINGFRSQVEKLVDDNILVIVLSNFTGGKIAPGEVAVQLSAIALGEPVIQSD